MEYFQNDSENNCNICFFNSDDNLLYQNNNSNYCNDLLNDNDNINSLSYYLNNFINNGIELDEDNALSQANFENKENLNEKLEKKESSSSIASEKTKNSTKTNINTKTNENKEKIFNISKQKKKDRKMLGRKRLEDKKETKAAKHTKFDFDNVVRKIKSNMFDALKNYLNQSLNEEEGEIIPKEKQRKRKIEFNTECFLKIEQDTVVNINVNENKKLLNITLREIFSRNVSDKVIKFSSYGLEHNKYFIEQLRQNERKKRTNKILDMTFLQCLKHVRGDEGEYQETLRGLEKEFEYKINEMEEKDGKEYVETFKGFLKDYEVLYEQKKSRNRSQK